MTETGGVQKLLFQMKRQLIGEGVPKAFGTPSFSARRACLALHRGGMGGQGALYGSGVSLTSTANKVKIVSV
ncbi:hypothetical protein LR69_00027 [Geobacillus sp. BCO2]|nr:hypothetical protein LR69_00027 [Geobacillus sp. BCO2]